MRSDDKETFLDLRSMYEGKTILLAGASGFLGKVFLSLILDRLPQVKKIYVLMRTRRLRTPRDRFEQMINKAFVFANLHERMGASLSDFLTEKIEMVEGDISLDHLGIAPEIREQLYREVDLFVNTAGLVDFNPDLREALSVNVEGTLHAARFVRASKKARLLHISTCFVSGKANGEIPESVVLGRTPNGHTFDPREEYAQVQRWIADHAPEQSQEKDLEKRREVRMRMIDEGMARAERLGWTNTYTYSKALSEQLLKAEFSDVKFSILRPSIVESALVYPFPGWNEGFNTCGPLAHLLGTWFRYLPAKVGNPFDVIPVDLVAKSMLLVGAKLLQDDAQEVYQCASSGKNLLTIDQAAEWTSDSHRLFYRRNGAGFWQRFVRPHWGVRCVGSGYPWFRAQRIEKLCARLSRGCASLGLHSWASKFDRYAKKWNQIHNLLEIFRPFIHDQYQIYRTDHLSSLSPEPRELAFDARSWDWKTYWLDVHMPGLRRWCFPVIRREPVRSLHPIHPFHWLRVDRTKTESKTIAGGE